ncbi:MAG TPA: TorF family putative porin [Usitatibacter sp.]|nr:TorF family putative porin [Usitatibacter sp.]
MLKLPKTFLYAAASCATLAAGSAFAQAPASPHTFTGKVGLYSEYEYRGISQTSEKPALQLNLDYGHASGFYVGTFLTNIKWLEDAAEVGGFDTDAKLEWDIYAGYRFEVAKDTVVDVGYLRYEYPSSGAFNPKPNTDEIYAGITWTFLNFKYSHSINNTFGVPNSKNSYFVEANIAYPIEAVKGLTVTGHIGYQEFKNNDSLSYAVWKAGAVYDFGNGWNVGGYVKGTDADSALYTYKGKDWSKDRLVAFVTYSF